MKLSKKLAAMFVTALTVFVMSTSAFASTEYDWDKGVIRAVGVAAGPKNGYESKVKDGIFVFTHARQAARIDALRNLAELVGGVRIEFLKDKSGTEIGFNTYVDDNIAIKIVSRGAYQVNSRFLSDYTSEVTMEMPIFGKNSAAEAVFSMAKTRKRIAFPNPSSSVQSDDTNYTGLIIDCRGFDIKRSLDPTIKNTNGVEIYSSNQLNYNKIFDKVVSGGMVEYVKDINKQTRAGKNSLTVKAVSSANGDPVISVEDADKILTANQKFSFLDNCAVVIVY